jgi:Pyridine nucleotide-disulphide oxidoreductase
MASPRAIGPQGIELEDGRTLPADLVVLGVGVRPCTDLAEKAGLHIENGVVDTYSPHECAGLWERGRCRESRKWQVWRARMGSGSVSRLQESTNLFLVAGIAHTAYFQALAVLELKLTAVRAHGGAGAAAFLKQFRDFRSVLAHVAAADQARQHRNITSRPFALAREAYYSQ